MDYSSNAFLTHTNNHDLKKGIGKNLVFCVQVQLICKGYFSTLEKYTQYIYAPNQYLNLVLFRRITVSFCYEFHILGL